MQIIIYIAMFISGFLFFNWLLGYRKNHIQIDLDERYFNLSSYLQAIEQELKGKRQGRTGKYIGDRKFIADGKQYHFIERNVNIGGVPEQRTILKPVKSEHNVS